LIQVQTTYNTKSPTQIDRITAFIVVVNEFPMKYSVKTPELNPN